MGRVFAYEDHNGWQDSMFLTDHELSDRERFCPRCELWSELIGEVSSKEELIHILEEHGITATDEVLADTFVGLVADYEKYSALDYEITKKLRDELQVGLFFYVNEKFAFSGCSLVDAESYGDFLIYPESHLEVWDRYECLSYTKHKVRVDYDYYPRGRVVYRKTDDLFIIYYDSCVESELDRLIRDYEGFNYITELDEHYCCHKCNKHYI